VAAFLAERQKSVWVNSISQSISQLVFHKQDRATTMKLSKKPADRWASNRVSMASTTALLPGSNNNSNTN